MKSLGRSECLFRLPAIFLGTGELISATEMPELQIESGFLPKLKERITLAKDIEKAQHLVKKENHDRNWLQEAAEAMDLDIDPGMCVGSRVIPSLSIDYLVFLPKLMGCHLSMQVADISGCQKKTTQISLTTQPSPPNPEPRLPKSAQPKSSPSRPS